MQTILPLLLPIALLLPGCLSLPGSDDLEALPEFSASVGTEFRYRIGRFDNTVDGNLTIRLVGERELVYEHRYPERPQFDTTVEYRASDGGNWNASRFACEPTYPHADNPPCAAYRGGYGYEMPLYGPFFGTWMLAGLPVESGQVHRTFVLAGQPIPLAWNVSRQADGIHLKPAHFPSMQVLSRGTGHANSIASIGCDIFNCEIVLDPDSGVPRSVLFMDEEDGKTMAPWWTLESTVQGEGPAFSFAPAIAPPPPPTPGARIPPAGQGGFPFPLSEAFAYAEANDSGLAAMVHAPDTWLGTSAMWVESTDSLDPTGLCSLCARTLTWKWDIKLHRPGQTAEFSVFKQVQEETGLTQFRMQRGEPSIVFDRMPRLPVKLASFEQAWDDAAALTGLHPIGVTYQGPYHSAKAFVETTGTYIPYVFVVFQPPGIGGIVPEIAYRPDGSMELFQANGAVEASYARTA